MKSIVFVISSMGKGGAERVISLLANHYAEKSWNVYIIMLWHDSIEYTLHSGVKIVDLSNDRISPYLRIVKLIYKLRKTIKKINPNAVVSFIAQNNVICGLACKNFNTRVILSERVDPSSVKRNFLLKSIINIIYSRASKLVLQTSRAYQYFPAKVRYNSVIIPNPIEVTNFAAENRSHRIVSVGRLTHQKNHLMLIYAFIKFHKTHMDYSLEIYGDGPLKNNLQDVINRNEMQNKVFLRGNVNDLHLQISTAEIFVLPSNYEGLSNALLEAMEMGLTCVSTNCSGSDEIITNSENGILIPIGDEDSLVKSLFELSSNEKYRRKLGENAKSSVRKFHKNEIIDKWEKIIEDK